MMNMFGSKKTPLLQSGNGGGNGADFGWISKSVEINGDVNFTDKLQVDGKVTGKLYSEKGTLIIGESGNIEAQIDVGICIIHGIINGNIKARVKVEIHRSGKLFGDVTTPALTMEDGAFCNGNIRMVKEGDSKIAAKAPAKVEAETALIVAEEVSSAPASAEKNDNPILSRVQSATAERARKSERVV